MEIKAEEISRIIKQQIKDYEKALGTEEVGEVISVGDGIARVYGLGKVMAGELIHFPNGIAGIVLNLEEDSVGIAIMGEDVDIKEGDEVKRSGRIAEVPVGPSVIGRVVNSVGKDRKSVV